MRSEVDSALEAWARWASNALSGLGIASESIISRIVEYGVLGAAVNSGVRLTEVDEVCELVDKAVLGLEDKQKEVVIRHYMKWEDTKVAAKACHLSYDRFRQVLSIARRRVSDFLEGARVGIV